jgi:type IV pilus assembly protein PilO
MAKSFNELSPKAQLTVFGLLSALAVGAAWQVAISPERARIAAGQARLDKLELEVRGAQAVAMRLPEAQREVRQLEAQLRETQAVIPEEKDPQDVLRNLHEMASDSLLDIASFKPRAIVTKAQHHEWPIEVGLEGTYHDLGRFFDRVASMPRLMSVSDLQIRTQTKPNGLGTVSVSCVTTTFVFQNDLTLTAATGVQP